MSEDARIEPGADPRARWAMVDPLTSEFHFDVWARSAGYALSECATYDNVHTWLCWKNAPRCPPGFRYVPYDVARWRNAEHREALMRRARDHAAIVPGVYR